MQIKLNGKNIEVRDKCVIKELLSLEKNVHMICAAFVNNVVKSLQYTLSEGDEVRFIDIKHEVGYKIYENTTLFIFSKALHDVCPRCV